MSNLTTALPAATTPFLSTPRPQLQSSFNGSEPNWLSLQDVHETLIRSATIHIVATASYGHLLTLRKYLKNRSATLLLNILLFILFLTLPIAQLLRQARVASRSTWRLRKRGIYLSYHTSVCLGIHLVPATMNTDTTTRPKPILEFEPSQLRPQREPYKFLWLGRIVILLALGLQYSGTIFLCLRRLYFSTTGRIGDILMWDIDTKNGLMAAGGLTAVMVSIAISFLNLSWIPSDNHVPAAENVFEMAAVETMPASDAIMTGEVPVNAGTAASVADPTVVTNLTTLEVSKETDQPDDPLPLTIPSEQGAQAPISRAQQMITLLQQRSTLVAKSYVSFRFHGEKMSQFLLRYFPLELRWDLELAYLLMMMFFLLVIPHDGFWGTIVRDVKSFGHPRQVYFRLSEMFFHAGFGFGPYGPRSTYFMMKLYLTPAILIMVHNTIWWLGFPSIIKRVPRVLRTFLSELDFWFRRSWTIFSISFSLVMIFPVYLQILFIKFDFDAIARSKEYWEYMGQQSLGYFWTDPLSDKLYII